MEPKKTLRINVLGSTRGPGLGRRLSGRTPFSAGYSVQNRILFQICYLALTFDLPQTGSIWISFLRLRQRGERLKDDARARRLRWSRRLCGVSGSPRGQMIKYLGVLRAARLLVASSQLTVQMWTRWRRRRLGNAVWFFLHRDRPRPEGDSALMTEVWLRLRPQLEQISPPPPSMHLCLRWDRELHLGPTEP